MAKRSDETVGWKHRWTTSWIALLYGVGIAAPGWGFEGSAVQALCARVPREARRDRGGLAAPVVQDAVGEAGGSVGLAMRWPAPCFPPPARTVPRRPRCGA